MDGTFDRRVAWTTFLVGVTSLGYELVQVRMLAFLIGNSMDFLAIPIALLGLAMGSMYRHFFYRGSHEALVANASRAVLPLIAVGFLSVFAVANRWFPEIHVAISTPPGEAVKVVVYSLLFLPPYLAFGAIFASLFDAWSNHVGKLYFYDLAGAALGCAATPLLLTAFGLPTTILAILGAALALFALQGGPGWLTGAAGAGVLGVAALQGSLLHERPDPVTLSRSILGPWKGDRVVEVDVRWNEIARTALYRAEWDNPGREPVYAIVQDNGLSNVTVERWIPDAWKPDGYTQLLHYGIPWQLGREPSRILVMFAGHGRDMIAFDTLTRGKADIVGVEINRTVTGWNHHPALASYRLPSFLERPNIHLETEEGRDFLNRDTRTYDLIYVANNGAVHASRTGHTRKFLDTREAVHAYLDRLEPDGLMVFVVQPIWDKLPALAEVAPTRFAGDIRLQTYVFGDADIPTMDTLIYKPSGFTAAEVQALDAMVGAHGRVTLHRPGGPTLPRLRANFKAEPTVTDDRPFTRPIGWRNLSILPDPAHYYDPAYVSGWVKAFTVIVFAGVALGVALLAGLAGSREQRVPAAWVAYLLASGVGYMCVEIPLIAKTELFIGNPLYAVSLNLAIFLVANAIGAWLQDTRRFLPGPAALAGAVVLTSAWGLLAATFAGTNLLSWPLAAKAVGVAVAVGPVGVVLGAFYPWCVSELVRTGHPRAIPMTYGLTTLSSVLGSALAMTVIVDFGFTRVIAFGACAYLVAAGLAVVARRGAP